MEIYDSECAYCNGTVRERRLAREPISHRLGIVILENVPIGICDRCGAHYYAADVVRRVEAILKSGETPRRTLPVPVEAF